MGRGGVQNHSLACWMGSHNPKLSYLLCNYFFKGFSIVSVVNSISVYPISPEYRHAHYHLQPVCFQYLPHFTSGFGEDLKKRRGKYKPIISNIQCPLRVRILAFTILETDSFCNNCMSFISVLSPNSLFHSPSSTGGRACSRTFLLLLQNEKPAFMTLRFQSVEFSS